ncbi:hypothetical protein IGI04_022190 [Brassica rapa subsp. trilocularis]|uniref:Uncharacterized protein n=1 Tax=Brassica rapa subsp. trilocularis TaxID=1813537 RepID=A0ABQ7M098_BRACM|nr:hypothetical protein IGI04_042982 [Brassica rapa subsp. trilocularis]KAG5392227.1 hypothetical protein IGI04_022190 [Brassica rapa subsp. trilocularis]
MSRRMLCRLWQNYPRRRRLLFVCPASLTLKVKLFGSFAVARVLCVCCVVFALPLQRGVAAQR